MGETDGLHERLAAHRGKTMWKSADTVAIAVRSLMPLPLLSICADAQPRRGGADRIECVGLQMPDGRSQARKAEAILIKEMHEVSPASLLHSASPCTYV